MVKTFNEKQIVNFWIESSDKDFETMNHLFDTKDYHWALFIGHLVIEKLLKAIYVFKVKKHPVPIHDLLRLSKMTELDTNEQIEDWLDNITAFNINARYDTYNQEFYKLCTKKYAEKWIEHIKELRKWLKEKLKES